MITLQEVRQHVSEQVSCYVCPDCYPMDMSEFEDLMTDLIFRYCQMNELDENYLNDMTDEDWREFDEIVCEGYLEIKACNA